MNIKEFWKNVLEQNEKEMRSYFCPDAYVNWHCSNEHFTVDEYIKANCEYPGNWDGEVERIHESEKILITVTHVYLKDKTMSFHVTSFIKLEEDKIKSLDEYWADDGGAPLWRQEMQIGKPIR
ncbi:MAG: nuclear transport factor 2 family protein [Lachnospiraceae bacterium]|nr:nuclear transport factor 2 family protein [Lachnospiraceae bacterium]